MTGSIGILGGTFDPVHIGHLRLAIEVREQFGLDEVRLVPLNIPPHRDPPVASGEHRYNMLVAATCSIDGLAVDDRELHRDATSWTIDTVRSLREDHPRHSLCLLMGEDAFATLDSWHTWEQLIDYAHIIIAARTLDQPIDYTDKVKSFYDTHAVVAAKQLLQQPGGLVCRAEVPLLNISSTRIRQLIADGRQTDFLVPAAIQEYILANKLYT